VISGPAAGIAGLLRDFAGQGIAARELRVSHAFHSMLMRPMVDGLTAAADRLRYEAARLPMVSTVTGKKAGAGDLASAGYWSRQVEAPVRFAAAAAALEGEGATVFL
jgi:acyl transferase domain-containing protein